MKLSLYDLVIGDIIIRERSRMNDNVPKIKRGILKLNDECLTN